MILRKDRKVEAASLDNLERTYAVMLHYTTRISANNRGIYFTEGQ
jgi:hypothetical protein